MIQSFNPPNMSDFQKRSLIVGIVFLVIFIAGAFIALIAMIAAQPRRTVTRTYHRYG